MRAYAYIGDTGGVKQRKRGYQFDHREYCPPPPSVLLMGSGLLGLVGVGWRRRKANA